jgi:hypothetical protein
VYSFAYDANTTTAARSATIQFKAANSAKTITVKQEGVPPTGQSITEIVALPDNSGVETLESVVVAKTGRGFVVSDGTTAIYAYDSGANAVEPGDVVKVLATKTTYNGVPELATLTSVEKTGTAAVNHPAVKDVTAEVLTYEASVAEYIQFTGTLHVSGNYYNVEFDGVDTGVKQGSIVYPAESLGAAAFDGQVITVTGYYNGLSSGGKFLNVIATKITGANAKGTLSNPYTPAEAAEAVALHVAEIQAVVRRRQDGPGDAAAEAQLQPCRPQTRVAVPADRAELKCVGEGFALARHGAGGHMAGRHGVSGERRGDLPLESICTPCCHRTPAMSNV